MLRESSRFLPRFTSNEAEAVMRGIVCNRGQVRKGGAALRRLHIGGSGQNFAVGEARLERGRGITGTARLGIHVVSCEETFPACPLAA